MKRKFVKLFFITLFLLLISACSKKKENPKFENLDIIHELEFGGVYITVTIDNFNDAGFEYGDSVDVEFSNDYKVCDIPYYNGYYVDAGETLLVGYPGYEYIKLTLNYGDDYWNIANLSEGDKGSIYLNKKGKYKDIQNTMNIQYEDDRTKYETDEEFANYRMVNIGNIKNSILYRGASPCDNKHKRASYVDNLIQSDGINFIVDLADTPEKIEGYMAQPDFASPYFKSLYERNVVMFVASPHEKVMPLAMNMNYKSDEFREKVADGFKQMLNFPGPYYIHCQEGKDRTGFVLIVIEALLGGTYQEIVDDYMVTYDNYYKITEQKDPLRYKIIKERNVDAMLKFLCNYDEEVYESGNYSASIKTYLMNGGMTEQQVNQFITLLSQ